ncbi:MAG: hypothetical protein WKF30_15335 [Pyrinomonadaceae bacterium]
MKNCLDDAQLQRRFDGESTAAELAAANAHLSLCSACARSAQDLESEAAIIAAALAATGAVGVPTLRLQTRLQAAINFKEADAIECGERLWLASALRRLEPLATLFAMRPQFVWGAAGVALGAVLMATIYLTSQKSNDVRSSDIAVGFDLVRPVPLRQSDGIAPAGESSASARRRGAVVAANDKPPNVAVSHSRSRPAARGISAREKVTESYYLSGIHFSSARRCQSQTGGARRV